VISPLFLMSLYIFVFGRVFDAGVERYPVFLLCGLLPWTFLTQALGKTILSISGDPEMIRKAPLPYELLPLGQIGGHAFNFFLTLVPFLIYLAARGELAYSLLPFLVLPVVALLMLVGALGLMVALIDVYNQDLRLVLTNILTLWFFLLPVVYRPAMAPRSLDFLRSVDPMSLIISQIRGVLYFGEIRQPSDHFLMLVISGGFFLVCLRVFRRFAPAFPKDV
jgi:ABC-type polysaccharide/polyol phosphate export permease